MPSTSSTANLQGASSGNGSEPLVRVDDLTVRFPAGRAGFWGQEKLFVHDSVPRWHGDPRILRRCGLRYETVSIALAVNAHK